VAFVDDFVWSVSGGSLSAYHGTQTAQPFIAITATVVFAWPCVAGAIKRLHDLDFRGWIAVVIIPGGLGFYTVVLSITPRVADVLTIVWTLALIGLLVPLCLAPGTHGPNRYGRDPKWPVGGDGGD